jgi:hypothetical protein
MIEIPVHVNNLRIDLCLMQPICSSASFNQIYLMTYRIIPSCFENKRSTAGGIVFA